ncbi:glycosyltransferase family 4 protein [Antrihabitans cavernicola]|uniref:Glycosyltransferase family 4 protein n=1 Tax=Antrihabitans cavernicola TaxID=2495913 RepID=A0A5A7SEL3_9NOCA|nr:glycosyltransferase family 4 protein [Spelaeibacter cavernicola]KAA0023859.1 glycosyltransferase family 4 protein [Spelaeibacter cavernicola]
MKVLICAPWFRTLARVHGAALASRGHDVRVATTDAQGVRSIDAVVPELDIEARFRHPRFVPGFVRSAAALRHWRPDVALLDMTHDFRFHALADLARKRAVLIHDATPHDASHEQLGWKKDWERRSIDRSDGKVAFSKYTADRIGASDVFRTISLASELATHPEIPNTPRQGFAFLGRISEYKGIDFLLEAWESARSHIPQSDVLTIMGSGELTHSVPGGVQIINGWYSDADATGLLCKSKALALPYREASQSGVQVAAMQHSTPTIVTNVGALPEFQPPGCPVVEFGDTDALARAIIELAGNDQEQLRHICRKQYDENHGVDHLGEQLDDLVRSL